ncbi:hypothetical protein GCM10010518_46910 [Kitasatospora cinereorecta]
MWLVPLPGTVPLPFFGEVAEARGGFGRVRGAVVGLVGGCDRLGAFGCVLVRGPGGCGATSWGGRRFHRLWSRGVRAVCWPGMCGAGWGVRPKVVKAVRRGRG